MSSSVCEAIGEVASLRAEGVRLSAAKRLFCKLGKVVTLILAEPLRFLRKHLPYPHYRAAEEDIATHPPLTAHNHTLTKNTPYPRSARQRRTLRGCPTSQFPQLSTINSQPIENTLYP